MFSEEEETRRALSNMTLDSARTALRESGAPAELLSLVDQQLPVSSHLRRNSQGLIQQTAPSGLQKARNMLNGMIEENNRKLDTLKTECSAFFSKQCSLMETCRSELTSANAEAAQWRSRILTSQKDINICEVTLPNLKNDLRISIYQCNLRLGHLRRDLAIVLSDIQVMMRVLKMTECKAKMIQMEETHIVECQHPCTKESFMAFHHDGLNEQLMKLKSSRMQQLVQQSLRDLSDPVEKAAQPVDENGTVIVNVTVFKNPPVPHVKPPSDPCKGITYDAGGKGGCTLRSNPRCFNLQNKFINIQGETVDKRDELLAEIAKLEKNCEQTQKTLSEQISVFETKHDTSTSNLAEATSGENDAGKEAVEANEEHSRLAKGMLASRKQCSAKMRTYESELCALKKIRGELMKMKGDKHPFFQDCEVTKWEPEKCSKSCGGGLQTMKRGIVSPQSGGGASCPPLRMTRACNQHPCPIDCKVSMWSRFSGCSSECGGGVRERMRKIKRHPKYEGEPCGDLTETEACNMQACDRNCKLGHWGKWSSCSKACDGGFKFKKRTIKVAAIGKGKCPKMRSVRRLRRKRCNTHKCPHTGPRVMACKTMIDLVLLLDGSGSIKKSGWIQTKKFATKFVDAFDGENAKVSVILFSGPRNWPNYQKCQLGKVKKADEEKICGLKMVQHFSSDMKKTKANIAKLAFPSSSTYTAKALEMANAELMLGRKDARRVVLVMTDGVPISPDKTKLAANKLKRRARLMFGAVRLNTEGLRLMRGLASKPTRDNVMRIKDFKTMSKVATMNSLIRDMCTKVGVGKLPKSKKK